MNKMDEMKKMRGRIGKSVTGFGLSLVLLVSTGGHNDDRKKENDSPKNTQTEIAEQVNIHYGNREDLKQYVVIVPTTQSAEKANTLPKASLEVGMER